MSLSTFDTTLIKILSHRPGKYVSSGQMHLIAKCEDGSVVKGYLDMPLLDERYRFYGEWRDQKGYDEKAFYFEFHEVIIDRSVNGIVDYLSRYVPHLGRVRSQALVEAFGVDVLDTLRREPEKALGVAGITDKIVANIKEHFEENIVYDPAAYAKLIDLLSDSKVSKRLITTLLNDFGSNAPDYILAHPYELMNYRRMGWIKTDRFALTKAKFHPTGAARYKAAIIETLLQGAAKDGHTAVGKVDVEMGATGLCGSRIPGEIWRELEAEGRIVKIVEKQAGRDGTELEKEYYSLMKLWHAEREIARLIVRIQENAIPLNFTFDVSLLEDEQIDAARLAERHGVAIIAGAPGCGKTHSAMELISQFKDHGIEPILVVAPTGKAGKRASEVLQEKLPDSEITASTIHKALGMGVSDAPEGVPSSSARVGRGREEFGFLHNEENPLECSIAVIDEMSMCDSLLFYYFLRSLPLGCRLLIVGDPHQLPPVGPGNPLRDLILGGVPTVLLTKPRRNSGAIVRACHEIKDGKFPKPCVKLDIPNGLNWVHIEERDPEKIADIIVTLHLKTKRDPLWDVQCISPENAKKVIACRNLNRRLSAVLNKGEKHSSEINSCDLPGMLWATQEREDKGGSNKGRGRKSKGGSNGDGNSGSGSSSGDGGSGDRESEDEESPFRIGDKIIRTRNGQVDLMTPFRFSASMDRLDEFDSLCDSLRPDEDMEFRRQFDREEDEAIDITWRGKPYTFGKTYVVNGDMGIVEDIIKFKGKFSIIVQFMNPDRLCRLSYGDHHLSQAYAVTIHKFQGSGIPYIIFPVHRCFYYNDKTKQGIFMRELIYTAFSRAEDALVTVGELGALYDGIKRKTVNMRKTRLYGFLRDEMRNVEVGS